MDGKIFLYSNGTPPRIAFSPDAFSFDLQRFAGYTLNESSGTYTLTKTGEESATHTITETTETEGGSPTKKYIFNTKEYDSLNEALAATGAKFSVTKGTGTGTITVYDDAAEFTYANLTQANVSEINVLGNITLQDSVGKAADSTTTPATAAQAVSTTINIANSATLDLNGKSLYVGNETAGIRVLDGATLTVDDSDSSGGGQIIHTYSPGTTASDVKADAKRQRAAIKLGYSSKLIDGDGVTDTGNDAATNNAKGVGLTMKGGTIKANSSAVCAGNNSSIVIEDGTIESNYSCGIYFGNTVPTKTGLDSSLNMTGGTVRSGENAFFPAIQVSGTMSTQDTDASKAYTATLNISGGTVEFNNVLTKTNETDILYGNPNAIYASANTNLTISGTATIKSTVTAVEFAAGQLEVTGGNISSTASDYSVSTGTQKETGATTFGAAIAIAQNGNKKPITVNISGDNTNISGANALAVTNPKNLTNDTAKKIGLVTATIDGGNLVSRQSSETGAENNTGNAILADKANVVITVNNAKLSGNVTVVKTKTQTKVGEADPTDTTPDELKNTQQATVVINGGTTNGTVKVVENVITTTKTSESDTGTKKTSENIADPTTDADAKSALKVTGGKITDKNSASKYITPGTTVSDNGTVTEIAGANTWSLQGDDNKDHYAYYVGLVGTGTSDSIITATINGSNGDAVTNNILRDDKTNKLLGIPSVSSGKNYEWISNDAQKIYRLAMYNTSAAGNAVTIKPETSNVKISGTGFIDSNVVTLAVSEASSLGVAVDATDNKLAHIIGAKGNDKFIAGDRNTTLDGGDGNDVLEGNTGNDLFLYSAGKDQINNYTYDSDIVSLNGANLAPPVDFNSASYDGTRIVIKFDAANANTMTFNGASKVALLNPTENGTVTYTYDAKSAGVWNYIAFDSSTEHGISLGAGHTSTRYDGSGEAYDTIDASRVTNALRIIGNGDDNYIVGATAKGGTLEGNDGKDTLVGSGVAASLTLNGGAGNDLMFGGSGYNYFVYSEGLDSISGYHGTDLINVDRRVSFADVNVSTVNAGSGSDKPDLLIKFDNDNQLSIAGGASADSVISLTSGRNNYAVTKDYIALNDKSITLTADYSKTEEGKDYKLFNGAAESYQTINAGLVENAISIVGNDNNNYIVGGLNGNSLAGGDGDDTLVGGTQKSNLFYYTTGKDVIENFGENDKLDISAEQVGKITSGKLTNSRLTFTVDKKNDLTFKFGDNEPFEMVSLNSDNSAYLTKDGYVNGGESSLDLFGSAKGRIDLTETLYRGAGIASVNAVNVKNQTVTLVGGSQGGTFAYATNKKRDGFEYGGGNVSISGYEGGRDRIDLNGVASLTSFAVSSDDVVLNIGNGTSSSISITSAKGEEVLLRDAGSRGYKKMVFAEPGIVQNKKSNPTTATVSSGATTKTYSFADKQTVKKIFVTDVVAGTSIQAGDRVNTIIDASKATAAVSLSGGNKNDKLIGSSYDDLFVYGTGKDVIQNFVSGRDNISLTGGLNNSLESAKITASKKSIKFKFGNKDVLTIKSNDTMSGALNINGENKIYFKNAIGDSTTDSVSLTSSFSGTFRTQDSKRTALPTATVVKGSNVEKNLTFVGSSEGETLIGGGKSNKKTMFKGGGGADSLVGGSGKDTFFYAKGNEGNAKIANFDFDNDKLKVASGIIGNITKSDTDKTITFGMTKGKSTDAVVGSFNITSDKDGKDINPSKVAIKANNTLYWFASNDDTSKYVSVDDGSAITAGTLITTENRISNVSAIPISDGEVSVIDLNYSTNLAKSGVAIKVKSKTTT